MADYVYNYLLITGPGDAIEKFRKTVCYRNEKENRDVIDFQRTLPMPDDMTMENGTKHNILRTTYGVPAWRVWAVGKYGTKTYEALPLLIDTLKDETAIRLLERLLKGASYEQ